MLHFVTLALSHSKVDFTEDKICVTCSYRKGESQPGHAFYVRCKTVEGSQTDIKINANTVDTFTFETNSAVNLSLDQTSFASGKGNITGSTYASAKLTANNKTNFATEHYNLYLNIENNTFTYTQGETKPEILLTIKDGS